MIYRCVLKKNKNKTLYTLAMNFKQTLMLRETVLACRPFFHLSPAFKHFSCVLLEWLGELAH